jgi:phosphoribosylanthranilate isomerase
MTHVKICGLRRVEDAAVAVEAGAHLIGLVFAESRRQVDPQTAAEISHVARAGGAQVVGVFVNEDVERMNRLVRECGLDYIQLSGDETDEVVDALDAPAIRTVHVTPDLDPAILAERIAGSRAALVLLDTARVGTRGGTGETFDWTAIPHLEREILLAGGLHAENVGEAIRRVRPWGVDVSSGVERDGVKDRDRIREFLAAARGA